MRVLGGLLVILAILISVVPQYTDCYSQGRQIVMENGQKIPMKCHWTARAEIVTGVPLLAVGAMMFFSKRKETKTLLGILGAVLGLLVVLLPTGLIGVCMNAEMLCNSFMKPFLIMTGSLTIISSLIIIAFALRSGKDAQTFRATPA